MKNIHALESLFTNVVITSLVGVVLLLQVSSHAFSSDRNATLNTSLKVLQAVTFSVGVRWYMHRKKEFILKYIPCSAFL